MVKVLKARLRELPMELIEFRSDHIKACVEGQDLFELVTSIKCLGMRQPVLVRPKGEGFELVVGDLRFGAHRVLQRKTISCVVAELNDYQCFLARAIHDAGGLYLVITPKEVVFSLGPQIGEDNDEEKNGG